MLKVIGHLPVPAVVKPGSGHGSPDPKNLAIKIISVPPEFVPDHAARKTFCRDPGKPYGADKEPGLLTKLAGEATVTGCIPEEVT